MAQPNYAFQKRQRDLAKQQKKKEKALRKASGADAPPAEGTDTPEQGEGSVAPAEPAEPNKAG